MRPGAPNTTNSKHLCIDGAETTDRPSELSFLGKWKLGGRDQPMMERPRTINTPGRLGCAMRSSSRAESLGILGIVDTMDSQSGVHSHFPRDF